MITRATIDEQFAICKRLYIDGHMPRPQFLKCVVGLAYEHAVLDQMEDVRLLLNECDEEYLQQVLPEQMKEDDIFRGVAYFVAQKVAERGVPTVSPEELMLAFARPAKA